MSNESFKIFPIGSSSLTIEFSNEISLRTNNLVHNLYAHFSENKFPGLIEIVPAYSSLSFFYDVSIIRSVFPDAGASFDIVKSLITNNLPDVVQKNISHGKTIEVQIKINKKVSPDLDFILNEKKIEIDQFIDMFTAPIYQVYMLGFLPGFAYMGEVDARIAVPRRYTPRLKVLKGSIGIAGKQTGIYPFSSPGGWQIIGMTDLELFNPDSYLPTLFRPGDKVKFITEYR